MRNPHKPCPRPRQCDSLGVWKNTKFSEIVHNIALDVNHRHLRVQNAIVQFQGRNIAPLVLLVSLYAMVWPRQVGDSTRGPSILWECRNNGSFVLRRPRTNTVPSTWVVSHSRSFEWSTARSLTSLQMQRLAKTSKDEESLPTRQWADQGVVRVFF